MESPSPPGGSPSNTGPATHKSALPSTPTTQSRSAPESSPTENHRTTHIQICDVHKPDPLNGRLELDEARISELVHLIARDGLLTPILVRKLVEGYELIAGNHRLAALRRLNRSEVSAIVIPATDYEAARLTLLENTTRTQLSPVEEAKQLSVLVAKHPNGVDGVAEDIHRRPEWILDRLDIADYPDTLLAHVHARRISLAAARLLARIADPPLREHHIHHAATGGCTARMARQWLESTQTDAMPTPPPPENFSLPAPQTYISETLARCALCRNYNELGQTRREVVCVQCLSAIQAKWEHEPADPTPPEPTPPAPAGAKQDSGDHQNPADSS